MNNYYRITIVKAYFTIGFKINMLVVSANLTEDQVKTIWISSISQNREFFKNLSTHQLVVDIFYDGCVTPVV